jgi:hypothetical protein
VLHVGRILRVSIHAPLAGSDAAFSADKTFISGFNPRSPRGERLFAAIFCESGTAFQSTLPSPGATRPGRESWLRLVVSIHARGPGTLAG